MSKFGGVDYILVVQSRSKDGEDGSKSEKEKVTAGAMVYAAWKNIPVSRRFSTRKAETTKAWVGKYAGKFSPLSGASLSVLRKEDKLFVFARARGSAG